MWNLALSIISWLTWLICETKMYAMNIKKQSSPSLALLGMTITNIQAEVVSFGLETVVHSQNFHGLCEFFLFSTIFFHWSIPFLPSLSFCESCLRVAGLKKTVLPWFSSILKKRVFLVLIDFKNVNLYVKCHLYVKVPRRKFKWS